ncbi:MAG: cytochrome b/b6 domain-containing protein [Massilia sp.]|nr:cytochrome b/b6 domain-containing protein [Massilia sp.]
MKKSKQRVWDAPVRVLHWLLVASMGAAWLTSSSIGLAHERIGYGAGAIVLARLAWGFCGSRHARFAQFVRPAAPTLRYLRAVAGGHAARHLGHNPLGGWMVLALLGCVAMLVVSGGSLTTDLLWGYAWPVQLHAALAWLLVALIALHVGGVLLTSWQHRENLVAAMLTGDKAPPGDGDQD